MKVTLRRSLLMALIVLMVVGCMVFGVGAASVDVAAADLQAAINNADGATTVKLTENVVLNETLTIPAGKDITLDLNGKTVTGANGATINSKGGLTIGDSVGGGAVLCDVAKEGTEAFLEVWGGTFSTDVSEYCATGYEAVQANGAWRVKFEIEALNKNTNKKYKTLAEAIAAAAPGQTVVLQGVVVIDSNLTIDKDVTISDYGSLSIAFVNGAGIYLKGNVALTVDQIVLSNVKVWSDAVNAGATVNTKSVTGVAARPAMMSCSATDFALENPVWGAKVVSANGTTYYESLVKALAGANAGETVVMLENVNASEIVTINKAITLDGNGKTLTSTAGRAINVDCNGEVTIKNLTVVASGERAINVINKSVQLTLDNVTATAANYAVNVAASAGAAKITVKNSTLTGLNVVNVTSVGADVAVIDTVLNCNDNTAAEGYGALVLNPDATNAKITATRVTFNISGDSAQAINSAVNGSISGTDNKGDDVLVAHSVAIIRYSNGTAYAFFTFAEALEKVKDGETIILLDVEGTESGDLTFDKNISFTITGYAPNYALPVVTFQNATVTIQDATILIPELDARQNATINVIDSIVHDAGSDSIAKSYFNGAINISGSSVVYMMQVTTMGYITVSGNAKLNATWQTNVYGNGMIVVKDNATFATAALQLTGKDYSDRDNTDADRVGQPATIVVDGASFIVGNVKSESGADYSYNSSKGINVGTIAGKTAVLDVKNGATVAIYMANGETANIGADGVVNVNASTFTVACRGEGDVTLTNNGKVSVSGVSKLSIPTLSGDETVDFLDGAIIKDSAIGGSVFVAGKVVFSGANTFGMIYDYGTLTDYYGTTANMEWSVEVGASVTLTNTARYGLGYGDKVTIYGSLSDALNARETLTGNDKALFMHGLVAQESKGWNCDSSFTAKDAYIIIGSNNSFGNKPGNYGGTYTFSFDNVVLDASRITFYEALSNTTLTFNNTDAKVGTFMTRDQDSEFVLINTKLLSTTTFNGNDEGNYHAGKLTLSNSTLTYSAPLVMEGGVLTVGADSKLTAPAITGTGKIVIDATGMRAGVVTTVEADLSGYTGEIEVINNNAVYAAIVNGKIVLVKNTIKIGNAYYKTLAEALAAAQNGDVVELLWAEGDAPIAMNGSVYGKTVTITGTATVDWSKGFLFIGRGGEGNGTVIFDNSKLTSASDQATYGIHVSGREKNTTNKYDGTLVIKNSTIELDYLINKGAMTLDASTLTVKNGFSIGGRPASETESGEDATATLDLTNGSKVVVNNHNGMGLGYEAIGVMNIDATSAFETTQAFLVTAKGTMNIAGTVKIAGALTLNGTVNLNDKAAKLTTVTEGLEPKFNSNVADHLVYYVDGAYVVALGAAKIGDQAYYTLQAAIAAAKDGDVVTLLCDATVDETMKVNADITIDLNGKTVTGIDNATGSFALIEIRPGKKLVVSDTVGTGKITLAATNDRDWNAYSSVISNQRGTLIVESGTIEHLGGTDMAYAIDILTNTGAGDAEAVINGGVVKSTYRAIRQFLNSTKAQNILTINGGTIEGANRAIWMQNANTNVNPGALTVDADVVLKGDVLVSGSNAAELDIALSVPAAAFVNGTVVGSNLPAGYEIPEVNGVFGLFNGVAKIGNAYYESLAEALAAAKDGETVDLLKDVTAETDNLNIETDITLDGHGFKVTSKAPNGKAGLRVRDAEAVIKNLVLETVNDTADAFVLAHKSVNPGTYAKATLIDCEIISKHHGLYIYKATEADLVVSNTKITVGYAGVYVRETAKGTVDIQSGTKIESTGTGTGAYGVQSQLSVVDITLEAGSSVKAANGALYFNGKGANGTMTVKGNAIVEGGNYDVYATQEVSSYTFNYGESTRYAAVVFSDWATGTYNGVSRNAGQAYHLYESLESAFSATETYVIGTITVSLLKDVTTSATITVAYSCTIEGNGHTITTTADAKPAFNVNAANVTFRNATLNANGNYAFVVKADTCTLSIENATITSAADGIRYTDGNTTYTAMTLNLRNTTLTAKSGSAIWLRKAKTMTYNIDNSTIVSEKSTGISTEGTEKLTINLTNGTTIESKTGNAFTLYGNNLTFVADSSELLFAGKGIDATSFTGASSFTIKNSTIESTTGGRAIDLKSTDATIYIENSSLMAKSDVLWLDNVTGAADVTIKDSTLTAINWTAIQIPKASSIKLSITGTPTFDANGKMTSSTMTLNADAYVLNARSAGVVDVLLSGVYINKDQGTSTQSAHTLFVKSAAAGSKLTLNNSALIAEKSKGINLDWSSAIDVTITDSYISTLNEAIHASTSGKVTISGSTLRADQDSDTNVVNNRTLYMNSTGRWSVINSRIEYNGTFGTAIYWSNSTSEVLSLSDSEIVSTSYGLRTDVPQAALSLNIYNTDITAGATALYIKSAIEGSSITVSGDSKIECTATNVASESNIIYYKEGYAIQLNGGSAWLAVKDNAVVKANSNAIHANGTNGAAKISIEGNATVESANCFDVCITNPAKASTLDCSKSTKYQAITKTNAYKTGSDFGYMLDELFSTAVTSGYRGTDSSKFPVEEITLLKNATITTKVFMQKDLVIYGNGFTLSYAGDSTTQDMMSTNYHSLTVYDLTFQNKDTNTYSIIAQPVDNAGHVTLEFVGCTFNTTSGRAIWIGDTDSAALVTDVILTDCTINGKHGMLWSYGASGTGEGAVASTLTIEDCRINADGGYGVIMRGIPAAGSAVSQVVIKDSYVESTTNAAVIFNQWDTTLANVQIINSELKAPIEALALRGEITVTVTGTTITGTKSNSTDLTNMRAVYVGKKVTLTMSNSSISANMEGGLCIYSANNSYNVFSFNNVEFSGYRIMHMGNQTKTFNASFVDCEVTANDIGFYFYNTDAASTSVLNMQNCNVNTVSTTFWVADTAGAVSKVAAQFSLVDSTVYSDYCVFRVDGANGTTITLAGGTYTGKSTSVVRARQAMALTVLPSPTTGARTNLFSDKLPIDFAANDTAEYFTTVNGEQVKGAPMSISLTGANVGKSLTEKCSGIAMQIGGSEKGYVLDCSVTIVDSTVLSTGTTMSLYGTDGVVVYIKNAVIESGSDNIYIAPAKGDRTITILDSELTSGRRGIDSSADKGVDAGNANITISGSTMNATGDVLNLHNIKGTLDLTITHSTLTSRDWAGVCANGAQKITVSIVGTLSKDANGKPVSTTNITGGAQAIYFGSHTADSTVIVDGVILKSTDKNGSLSNAVDQKNADGTPKSWKQTEEDATIRYRGDNGGKITVKNTVIESAAYGMRLLNGAHLTMENVEMTAYLEGIYMNGNATATIKGSTLTVTGIDASLGNYHTWEGSNRVFYMITATQLTVVDSTLNYNGKLGCVIYLADNSTTKVSLTNSFINSGDYGLTSGGKMASAEITLDNTDVTTTDTALKFVGNTVDAATIAVSLLNGSDLTSTNSQGIFSDVKGTAIVTMDDSSITSYNEGMQFSNMPVLTMSITGTSTVKSTNAAALRFYLEQDDQNAVNNITIALDAMGDEPSIWGKTYGIQNHNFGNYNYTFVNAWVQGDTNHGFWKSTHNAADGTFAEIAIAEFNLTATDSRFVGGATSTATNLYSLALFPEKATSKMTVVLNNCDFGGTWTTDASGNITSHTGASHWGMIFHGLEGSSLTINGGVYLSKNDNLKLYDYVDVKINDAFVGSNGGWMVTYNHSGAGACSMLIENSVLKAAGKAINFTGGANTALKSIVIKDSYIEAGGAEGIQIQTPYAGDEIIVDISNTTLFSTNTWAMSVNTSDASVATSKVHVTLTNCNFGGSKAADGTVTAASHKGVRFEGANGSTFTIDGGYYYTNHDGFLFRDFADISFTDAEIYINATGSGWGIFYQAINDLAGAASMYFENCNVVACSRAVSYDGSIASFMNGLTIINTTVQTRGNSNAVTVKAPNGNQPTVKVVYTMDKTIAAQGVPTIDAGGYGTCFVTATALELDFKNVWIKSVNDCFNVGASAGSTDVTLTFADGKLDCTSTANNAEGWGINVYGEDADVTVNVTNTDFSGKSGIKCDPTGNGTRTVNVIGNENGGNTMVLGGRVLQIGQNVTMVVENYDIEATGMLGNDTWCIMYAKNNATLTLKNVDFDAEIGRDIWKGVRAIHLANGSSVTLNIIDSTVTSNKVAIRTSMDFYDKTESNPDPDDADLNTTTIVLRNSTIEANERFGIYLNGKNASFFRLTLDNSKVINHYDGHDLKKDVYGYAILADDFRSEITITGDSLIEANGAFMTAIRIGGGAAGTINMTGGKIVADWAAIEMDYGYNASYGPNNGYGQITLNINLPESARNTPSIVSRNWHAMWLKGVAYQNTTMSNVYVQAHSNVVHRGNHTNASVTDYSKNVTDVWQYCKFVSTGDPSVNDADAGLYYSLLNNDGAYAKYDLTLFHCEVYGREYGIGISGRPGAGSVLNIVGGKIGGEYTFVDYFTGETHTYSAQHGILVGGEVTINVNGELADDPTTAVVGDKYVPTSAKDRVTIGGTTTGIILKKSTTTITLNLKYADISGNKGIHLDHTTASNTYWNLTDCTVTATEEVLTKSYNVNTKLYVVVTNTTLTSAGGAGDKRAVYMGGHFHLTMDNSKIYYNNATGNAFYFANNSTDLNLTMRNGSLIESLGGGIHAGGEANNMTVDMDDSHIKSVGIAVYFGNGRDKNVVQSLTMTGTSTLYSGNDYAIKAYPYQSADAKPLVITMNMDEVGATPHIYGKTRGISIHNHCNVEMNLTNAYIGTDGDHAIWKSGHKMDGVGEVTFVLTATDSKFVGKTSWAINLFDNISVQAVSKNTVTLTNCNVGGYKDANGNVVGESNGALAMEGVEGTTLTIIGGYYYSKESGIRIRESADIVIKNTELYFGTNSNGWGLYIEHNSNDNKDPKTYYNLGGVASLYMENVTVNSAARGVSYESNNGNDNAHLTFMTLIDVTIFVRTQSNAITLQNFSKSVAPVFTWTMSEAYDLTKGYTGDTAGYGAYLISKYTEMDATFTNVALRSTKDNAFTIEGVRTHGKDVTLTLNNCYIDGYTTAATVTYSTDITVKNTVMVSQGKHRLDGTDKQTSVIRWSSNTQNSKFVAEDSTFLLKYLDAVTARALWSSNGTMTKMDLTNCTITVEGTAGVGFCRGGGAFNAPAKETTGTYSFTNCTITAPTHAIFFEGQSMTEANFIFKDCVLTNELSSLIYCKQPANVYVEGSTLTSSYNAIQVNGNKGTPNKVTVIDSTVTSANDCGFYFDVNSNIELTIKDSTFETQKWIALFDNKTSGVTVENSTLTSKTQHVFRVDATDGLAEIRITDSELTSLANSAIYGADAAALSVYVENSDLIAKGYAGMDVRGSRDASNPAKVTVKNSYIEAATYGIVVYFAMDMTVEDSTVVSMGKGAGTNSNETAAIRFSSNTSNGSLIIRDSELRAGWLSSNTTTHGPAVYGIWSSNGTLRRLEMYNSSIVFTNEAYGNGIGKGGDKFNAPAKETTGVYILENCSILAPQTAFTVNHSTMTEVDVTIKSSAIVSGNGNGLNFNGFKGESLTLTVIDSLIRSSGDALNFATMEGAVNVTVTNTEVKTTKHGGIYIPKATEANVNVTNSYFDVQTFAILVGAPTERGEINVTNCQMKNRAADHIFTINGASKDVVMNVYGGSYVSTGTAEGRVMTLNGYARANIYGGYFEADGYCVIRALGYSELNLYGGRYVSSSTGAGHDTWHCVICLGAGEATDPYRQAKINVYGGHYEGVDTLYQIFRNFEGRALNLYSFTAKGAQYIMTYADGQSIEMEYETAEHSYSGRTPVMYDGAQLRLVQTDKNSGGIRFATKIDKDTLDYAKFMTKNDASIVYGTIIVPLDYLMDENGNWILGDFSVASLEAAGLKYLNVVAENGIIENADGSITLLASISEIKEQNYDRKFAAIGYVKYELNGQDLYLYSAFDPANNARSLREMADAALKDTVAKQDLTYRYEVAEGVYSRYSAEQRALLAIYNNCQVVEEIVIEPTPTTAGLKRVTCATCGTYYEEIILPTTSYKVLVVGENLEENVAELEATLAGSGIPEIVVGWMDSEGAYYKQFAGVWSEMLVTPNDWDEIYVILTAEELGITEDTTAEEFAVIGEKIEAVRAEFEARFDGAKVTIYVPQMV